MKQLALILSLCSLVAGCATPQPVTVTERLNTSKDEQMLWRRAQEEQEVIDNSGLLYQDAELEKYLNKIAQKLQGNTTLPDFSYRIKVLKDPHLNAFAFPNGVIYVHTGILARMNNEAQLAALLAHEMAHCAKRHSLRAQRSIKDRPSYITAIRQTLEQITMARELIQFLGLTEGFAAANGYTRELEVEADRVGLDLTVKANYDPKEALNLFEHLKQEIESEGIKEPFFFGAHPDVQQRLENISNWLTAEYEGKNTGIKNTQVFQSQLHRLILDNAELDLRLGRFYIAQKTVERYLRTNPNEAQAHYMFGEICRQRGLQGDAADAVDHYEKAIALDPSFPEPHKAIGLIHYKGGEKRLARKYFKSCLLLSPNASDNAYIQGYLKKCMHDGEES